jgi:hypothetical protein
VSKGESSIRSQVTQVPPRKWGHSLYLTLVLLTRSGIKGKRRYSDADAAG